MKNQRHAMGICIPQLVAFAALIRIYYIFHHLIINMELRKIYTITLKLHFTYLKQILYHHACKSKFYHSMQSMQPRIIRSYVPVTYLHTFLPADCRKPSWAGLTLEFGLSLRVGP